MTRTLTVLPFRFRLLVVLLLCLAAIVPGQGAQAQKPAHTEAPAAAPPPAGITAEQARQALDLLNDPAKRAAFTATLNAITRAQPAGQAGNGKPADPPADAAAVTTPGPISIPLAPNSLGAEVLVSASAFVSRLGDEAMRAFDTVQSLPLLYGWAVVMVTNPVARELLLDVAWRLGVALIFAVAAVYALHRITRKPMAALAALAPAPEDTLEPEAEVCEAEGLNRAEEGDTEPLPRPRPKPTLLHFLRRVPLVLGRLSLDLIPVLAILVIGHLTAVSVIGGQSVSSLIILAVTDAYALSAALLSVARMVLSPKVPGLRLLHIDDATADYLMRWTRRLVVIGVVGYAVGEAWLLLGLSDLAHQSYQKAVGLILYVCLGIIVLQSRTPMRNWLSAPPAAEGTGAMVRNRFASVWHWVALFFIVSLWLAWAIELPHGYEAVLRYAIITAALVAGARILLLLLTGGLDRATRPSRHIIGFSPIMDRRIRAYVPMINGTLRLTIYALCVLGLLQLYGLNTFVWLTGSVPGQRILSSLGTILATIVMAIAVWEMVNIGVQRHLERLQREAQVAKSARLRTLLPLLRTTVMIVIAIVAGLMVLSEIGINIAPLLAGAGILGVAIGLGSQKLMQDLITGIFLLLENAMQVGDFVTVSGLSGTVEALSVRTIRLRAVDGSVHIIPFSAVTSVTNVNRGLGNAAVNVQVDFDEDTDRVCAELKAVVAGMRAESNLSALMLSDLQLWGVEKVDGAAVTIAGQVVCTDSGRWTVQREFNRRMKKRFQELGIRVFNPARQIAVPVMQPQIEQTKEQKDDDAHARAAE